MIDPNKDSKDIIILQLAMLLKSVNDNRTRELVIASQTLNHSYQRRARESSFGAKKLAGSFGFIPSSIFPEFS